MLQTCRLVTGQRLVHFLKLLVGNLKLRVAFTRYNNYDYQRQELPELVHEIMPLADVEPMNVWKIWDSH